MKELIITNKILNWYDIHKRTLPWRKKTSLNKFAINKPEIPDPIIAIFFMIDFPYTKQFF